VPGWLRTEQTRGYRALVRGQFVKRMFEMPEWDPGGTAAMSTFLFDVFFILFPDS
jgi:hypothetical protein